MDAALANTNSTTTFKASRWTRDNFLFPTRIEVGPERVLRIKSKWFGRNEESIPISKVASVHIETGIVWADIRIDSNGGTDPILSHANHNKQAKLIHHLT